MLIFLHPLFSFVEQYFMPLIRHNACALTGLCGVVLSELFTVQVIFASILMTIKQARKVLGKLSENISDEELEREIKAAELLKTLFFQNLNTSGTPQLLAKSSYGKS